jgi:hypothetical protein
VDPDLEQGAIVTFANSPNEVWNLKCLDI